MALPFAISRGGQLPADHPALGPLRGGPGLAAGRQIRQQRLRISPGVGPHQGDQPLAPLRIVHRQQQQCLQGQTCQRRSRQQAFLQLLREDGFSAAVDGPIEAAPHQQTIGPQLAAIAAAPPARPVARQGLQLAGLQPARAEPAGPHGDGAAGSFDLQLHIDQGLAAAADAS